MAKSYRPGRYDQGHINHASRGHHIGGIEAPPRPRQDSRPPAAIKKSMASDHFKLGAWPRPDPLIASAAGELSATSPPAPSISAPLMTAVGKGKEIGR